MTDGTHPTIPVEAQNEVRALIARLRTGTRSEQRMARARLRRMGVLTSDHSVDAPDVEQLLTSIETRAEEDGRPSRALVEPHPSGNIFRVAVGETGRPIEATWSAFDQRYQWFGKKPQAVTSGAHLFVLAVDRWRSAVVGLYEAVSAGSDRLPGSPDPKRWEWALGVRPLAAIPPPYAERVHGQQGPHSGLPERVYDESVWPELYAAVAASPPPPGPRSLEQRVQELEWQDVAEDVLAAVQSLGREAKRPQIVERAIEIGGWSADELNARAWYTGSDTTSHIESIVRTALEREHSWERRLERLRGGLYRFGDRADPPPPQFGVAYRPASSREATEPDNAPQRVDLAALDAATARHMALQDALADELRAREIEPRSPGSWQPQFDLAFEYQARRFIVEVKTGAPVSAQQVRLGVGQVLEYCHVMRDDQKEAQAVLLLEGDPPEPWSELLEVLRIEVLRSDELAASLSRILGRSTPSAPARRAATAL